MKVLNFIVHMESVNRDEDRFSLLMDKLAKMVDDLKPAQSKREIESNTDY